MPDKATIKKLAVEFLTTEGQLDIEDFLDRGKMKFAQSYLLGAIDSAWFNHKIGDAKAREAYALLGIPPTEAARIRQKYS